MEFGFESISHSPDIFFFYPTCLMVSTFNILYIIVIIIIIIIIIIIQVY